MNGIEIYEPDYGGQSLAVLEGEVMVIIDLEAFEKTEYTEAEVATADETGLPVGFIRELLDIYANAASRAARQRRAVMRGVG